MVIDYLRWDDRAEHLGGGKALTIGAVELALAKATDMTLRIRMRPHDFRRCAAVTAAYQAGNMPNLASALLPHRDRRSSDEHSSRTPLLHAGLGGSLAWGLA
jgi:hypothetical protein